MQRYMRGLPFPGAWPDIGCRGTGPFWKRANRTNGPVRPRPVTSRAGDCQAGRLFAAAELVHIGGDSADLGFAQTALPGGHDAEACALHRFVDGIVAAPV